ncbi:MAG: type II toxin-antitoxin system HicB family antitoxin [Candidatus Symbiothrix sp.]|jgi:predicted HicB family RNase H-like nuclease|nr:type II toxin-antitoxin system HicB family antitoxin [Candidatus Symbiothrix sp.]
MDKLEYKGYYGSIEYSKEDKMLYGKVLGLAKDCISYEGSSVEELENDFKAGIDSYIEGCKELGIEPRKAYNGILNIRIPSEIHCKVAIIAEHKGTSINALIKEAIEHSMELQLA